MGAQIQLINRGEGDQEVGGNDDGSWLHRFWGENGEMFMVNQSLSGAVDEQR
jgi:hypothetical protein